VPYTNDPSCGKYLDVQDTWCVKNSAGKSPPSRDDLLKTLDETLRNVGAQSVLMSDAVAKLVGLNSTDLECLDMLGLAGATTAGRLASATGLTTGAMTAVIDRLERAGFARRVRDAEDRRCVLVEARPEKLRRIEMLYVPIANAVARLNEEYGDRQLAVIVDYLSRAVTLAAEHLVWLQKQPPLTRRPPARRYHRRRMARARTPIVSASLPKD
jgi:DNA-binding MarR family transcriptional regulator